MAAALTAHELGPIGADCGEVAVRGRLDRPFRRGTVVTRPAAVLHEAAQRHRRACRHLPGRGGRRIGAPSAIDRVCEPRTGDDRNAAARMTPLRFSGRGTTPTTTRRSRAAARRVALQMPPLRHLILGEYCTVAAARRDRGQRAGADDGCRLPLDESGSPGAAQGNPGVRQADSARRRRPAAGSALRRGRSGFDGRSVRGCAARRHSGVDRHRAAPTRQCRQPRVRGGRAARRPRGDDHRAARGGIGHGRFRPQHGHAVEISIRVAGRQSAWVSRPYRRRIRAGQELGADIGESTRPGGFRPSRRCPARSPR